VTTTLIKTGVCPENKKNKRITFN